MAKTTTASKPAGHAPKKAPKAASRTKKKT